MEIKKFTSFSFGKRLKSMLKVDFKRMLLMPIFYIMIGVSIIIPILILVMTSMMVGTESIDPITGEVTIMEAMFTNVWQAIGAIPGQTSEMVMDVTTMCNINMMFFMVAVFVCIFVSEDFRSGYCKNLFTVRSNKVDYVVSKSIVGFVSGGLMILGYFIGTLIGGAIASVSFEFIGFGLDNVVMCMLAKVLLVGVFVGIFLTMSLIGKQKTWLSMILSFGVSMLLFMMISSITPLNSTIVNVILSLVGSLLFLVGLGVVSVKILEKTSLV